MDKIKTQELNEDLPKKLESAWMYISTLLIWNDINTLKENEKLIKVLQNASEKVAENLWIDYYDISDEDIIWKLESIQDLIAKAMENYENNNLDYSRNSVDIILKTAERLEHWLKTPLEKTDISEESKKELDKKIFERLLKTQEIYWEVFMNRVLILNKQWQEVYYHSWWVEEVFQEDIKPLIEQHNKWTWLVKLRGQEWEYFDILITTWSWEDAYKILLDNSEGTIESITAWAEEWVWKKLSLEVIYLAQEVSKILENEKTD